MKKKLGLLLTLALLVGLVYFVVPTTALAQTPGPTIGTCDESCLDPLEGPTNQTFDTLNPIPTTMRGQVSTPGGLLTRLLTFALPIAGMILFIMLVWAGFEILTNAENKQAVSNGKNRATAAVVGFVILFCSYWMMQILEFVFGIHIL